MTDLERGARELVRDAIRQCGLKHESTKNEIWTICYADQPHHSIKFTGPVCISFDLPYIIVKVHKAGDSLLLTAIFNGKTVKPVPGPIFDRISTVKLLCKIDLSEPNCTETLKSHIDNVVTRAMKTPNLTKRYFEAPDYVHYAPNFVYESERPATPGLWTRIKMAWKFIRNEIRLEETSPDKHPDLIWRHALARHGIDSDLVLETVRTIEFEDHEKLDKTTAAIIAQQH